ncbi:MAG: hypothetical protein IKR59_06960 [Lachnospiraceae bacterium]|nr:hypothetical protein [Lachnospiraceae bacterium]
MNLWNNALCALDEDLVEAYASTLLKEERKPAKKSAAFYTLLAACLALGVIGAALLGSSLYRKYGSPQGSGSEGDPRAETIQDEMRFERQYMTTILTPEFADYHAVRVCDEAFVGEMLQEILVEGGWKNSDYEYIEEAETLRAVAYSLKDVPTETAVCVKFIDLGDALTTTHYYVYVRNDVSEETMNALREKFGWNVRPDAGPAANGTVMMTTSTEE